MAMIRAEEPEHAKMNLTPMIDMTFLLVVFFMLTIDLSRKEFLQLDLPRADRGIEDKDEGETIPRFVINLLPEGDIYLKGQRWRLATGSQEEQAQALDNLRNELSRLTNNPQWREEDRSSRVPVMIYGDRNARWQYVQWIMQVCADPRIQIYKIQFACKGPPPEEERRGGA
jgi:biopolymer transport protein ExbD